MAMQKINVLCPTFVAGETIDAGIKTLDEKIARQLIGAGKAVPVVEDRASGKGKGKGDPEGRK